MPSRNKIISKNKNTHNNGICLPLNEVLLFFEGFFLCLLLTSPLNHERLVEACLPSGVDSGSAFSWPSALDVSGCGVLDDGSNAGDQCITAEVPDLIFLTEPR